MRILIINSVCGIKSTGRICTDIAQKYISDGHQVKIAYGRETVPQEFQSISVRICNDFQVCVNGFKSRFFDNEGFNSKRTTRAFLKWADEFNPDVLWLHNLHGYYLNVEMLFNWIKSRPHMEVIWTLHDCWAFTGHCSYFSMAECYKWTKNCENCPQIKSYPSSFFKDNSRNNFLKKKSTFTGVKNLKLITPSNWLADHVKNSFLCCYPVDVVYNTIDTSVFRHVKSSFRKDYKLQNKIIILGVASVWEVRKGLSDFILLSEKLDDSYKIVLVGLTEKQKKNLPKNIIAIPRIDSKETLAHIYSAADVFVNTSKEETFGLTTLEAISCGTPAIVYKNTACEEVINIFGNGVAVENSIDALVDAIKNIT